MSLSGEYGKGEGLKSSSVPTGGPPLPPRPEGSEAFSTPLESPSPSLEVGELTEIISPEDESPRRAIDGTPRPKPYRSPSNAFSHFSSQSTLYSSSANSSASPGVELEHAGGSPGRLPSAAGVPGMGAVAPGAGAGMVAPAGGLPFYGPRLPSGGLAPTGAGGGATPPRDPLHFFADPGDQNLNDQMAKLFQPDKVSSERDAFVAGAARARAGAALRAAPAVRVACATWNVAAKPGALQPETACELLSAALGGQPAGLVAIGLQEVVELNAVNVVAASLDQKPPKEVLQWQATLHAALNGLAATWNTESYVLLGSEHLVGICLFVYAQDSLHNQARHVKTAAVATGVGGVLGNKGAATLRCDLAGGTSICFVCAHMAAHRNAVKERNEDFRVICSRPVFPLTNRPLQSVAAAAARTPGLLSTRQPLAWPWSPRTDEDRKAGGGFFSGRKQLQKHKQQLERTASLASLASEMDAEQGKFAAPWATPRVDRRTLSPPIDEVEVIALPSPLLERSPFRGTGSGGPPPRSYSGSLSPSTKKALKPTSPEMRPMMRSPTRYSNVQLRRSNSTPRSSARDSSPVRSYLGDDSSDQAPSPPPRPSHPRRSSAGAAAAAMATKVALEANALEEGGSVWESQSKPGGGKSRVKQEGPSENGVFQAPAASASSHNPRQPGGSTLFAPEKTFSTRSDGLGSNTVLDHDYLFWIGDLNYRMADTISIERVLEMVRDNNLDSLIDFDQLKIEQRAERCFEDFEEGEITFPPTYKYIPGTCDYDQRPEKKLRCPSWTDRVLFRARKGTVVPWARGGGAVEAAAAVAAPAGGPASPAGTSRRPPGGPSGAGRGGGGGVLRQLAYGHVPGAAASDHRPVHALFELELVSCDEESQEAICSEIQREWDEHALNNIAEAKLYPDSIWLTGVGPASAREAAVDLANAGARAELYYQLEGLPPWVVPPARPAGAVAAGARERLVLGVDGRLAHRFGKKDAGGVLTVATNVVIRISNGNDVILPIHCELSSGGNNSSSSS